MVLYTSITDQAARLGLVLRSFQFPPSPPRSGLRFQAIRSGTNPASCGRTLSSALTCHEKTARMFSLAISGLKCAIANACFQVSHGQVWLPENQRPVTDGVTVLNFTAPPGERQLPFRVSMAFTATRVCSGVASGFVSPCCK
ncbi:hypothetical protein D3C71_1425290 [compost metagenome]